MLYDYCFCYGLPMAYVLRSVKIPGSKYLNILIVISYLSPPFIGAYAWIQLLGRNGFVTQIINSIFGVKLDGISWVWQGSFLFLLCSRSL